MGDTKLTSPFVRVTRDGFPDPLEVQTDNRDMLLWEETRVKHRWAKFDEAPVTWLTFLAWSAARRTGAIPVELRWEEWRASVLDITAVDDDAESEAGNPTDPGPVPG